MKKQYNAISNKDNVNLNNLGAVMSKLSSLIERMPLYEKKPSKFIDEFRKIIDSNELVPTDAFIYDVINKQFNGALERITLLYELKSYEVSIIAMTCMGFSNGAISVSLNHTNPKTIYNYRNSLKNKLQTPIDRHSLIEFLQTQ